MSWRPNSTPEIAAARARMLATARSFFADRNVLEVSTPALTACTTPDPNIESVVANVSGESRFLHTSPEHFMKRLLAASYPDIYQVCNVYRDGEIGHVHLPEFSMLEWYRRGFELQAIMRETADLVARLMAEKKLQQPRFVSYCDAFGETLSLHPLNADVGALADSVAADAQLSSSLGDDRDAWLDLAMASRVAKSFEDDRLTLVYHYPASQAALARLCPHDNSVADRFELYCGTVELANGFVELTNASEQKARMEIDRHKRKKAGHKDIEPDENLLDALRAGMPEAAGVALGLDRLLMIDQGAHDIRSITTFTPGT